MVPDGRAIGVVLWSGDRVRVTAGSIRFATLPAEPATAGWAPEARRLDEAPQGVAPPDALAPVTSGDDDTSVALHARLWRYTAAAVWAQLASGAALPDDDTRQAALEFFGYRRTSHVLGPAGPELDETGCRAAYRLWEWVTSDASPDRLLAVRQVVACTSRTLRGTAPTTSAAPPDRCSSPSAVTRSPRCSPRCSRSSGRHASSGSMSRGSR